MKDAPFSDIFSHAHAWPFQEAKKLLPRVVGKDRVLFETGYGPSGLPHIGTFGEVVRTLMVQHAFQRLSPLPTELFCFSDDMDGLRKVPGNVPGQEYLKEFLNKPLTQVPDPFGKYGSFGEHNNEKLKSFLDSFGFGYTFLSATQYYQSGLFDPTLLQVLACHTEILNIIKPTLGAERQGTYSPFLPISPKTGRILQVAMEEYRVSSGTIIFRDEEGALTELPVTGGHCKLQWKVDWGMRWKALGVDYEMFGKDLIDSVRLSSKICTLLGGIPPEGLQAEHFLDEQGRKISKSVGNGIGVEDWLKYAPVESLGYFMYQSPRRAKRLFFDVIPCQVDGYLQDRQQFFHQSLEEQLENPVWHVHNGQVAPLDFSVNFTMLLNLVSVCQGEAPPLLWKFLQRYAPHLTPQSHPFLDKLVGLAVHYYVHFVKPFKQYRLPSATEHKALEHLKTTLEPFVALPPTLDAMQTLVYQVGKEHLLVPKEWFSCLYEVLLGQKQGPRMGSFIVFYGVKETQQLIEKALRGELLSLC